MVTDGYRIMKILMLVGFNLEMDEPIENSIKIGKHNLTRCKLKTKKWVLMHKASKATKKSSHRHQTLTLHK